jgi:primary-amine oxidase
MKNCILASMCTAALMVGTGTDASAAAANAPAVHSLDALSEAEIGEAARIVTADNRWGGGARIASISLLEPPKADVIEGRTGPRRSQIILLLADGAARVVVNLSTGTIEAWETAPGRQPSFLLEELMTAVDVLKADPEWQAAMRRRGITDFSGILCNPLAVGAFGDREFKGRRLVNVSCYDATGARNNTFARPVEGVMAVVDLHQRKLARLIDLGAVSMAKDVPQHDYASQKVHRTPLKPVLGALPEGPNVTVKDGLVRWDNWSFHLRLDRRVGHTISLLRWNDFGKERSVAYQIAPSEMFVPYMDPDTTWSFKSYLDAGEYGLGLLATPLSPGRDCPANAIFRDAVVSGDDGKPVTIPRAICIYERNAGEPLWRHTDMFTQDEQSRPGVELVIRSISVIGNYDYVIDYVLNQAAEIEVRVGATGIDAVKGVESASMRDPRAAAETAVGTLVAPRLVGVNHDHYVAFRLDLDIDSPINQALQGRFVRKPVEATGVRRSIWQIETSQIKREGPVGNSHSDHDTTLRIAGASAAGALGHVPGYALMPGHQTVSLLDQADPIQQRAAFSGSPTWLTRHNPEELYASGFWANQSDAGEGLPAYVKDSQSIADADLVLWQVVGFRHVTRTEDWPIMPILWHSFRLRPHNFFDRNPAMDVSPDLDRR